MKRNKSRKSALLMSALSLLTCMTMLIGSTFAWFTDSVTSSGNIIKSGTLKVAMDWADGTKAVPAEDSTEWTDASTGAIFKNDKWEPGYVEVRHLRIKNEGSLALKYQLNIAATGEVSELADVIDVYYVDPAEQVPNRTALSDSYKLGTLTDALAGMSTTASGNLESGKAHTITIALKMQESANNDYQNKAIGSDFAIQLFATQLTSEDDSFDDLYDKNAWHPEMTIVNTEDLEAALANSVDAKLGSDVAIDSNVVLTANLDLGGKTLSANSITATKNIDIINGTLEMPDDNKVYAQDGVTITLENVIVDSDKISAYAGTNGTLILKDVLFENTATSNPIQNYGGTLIMDGVTVAQSGDANTSWYSSAVQVINRIQQNTETGKYEILSQANTTINSGTYTGKKAVMISAPGGNVTINGGNFIGSEYAIQADFAPQNYTYGDNYESVITITGGNFTGGIKKSAAAKVVISGGTFSVDPSAYLADGYAVIQNSDGTYTVVKGVVVTDGDSLKDSLENGKDVVLSQDVNMESDQSAPYGNKYAVKLDGGVLDGNGNELHMECYGDDYGVMTSGGTVKNIIIKEGCRAIMIMYPTKDIILDNVNIGGNGVLYPINTGEAGAAGVKLIVTNSTLAGWTSFSNIESASFTNVKFEQGTYYNNIYGRVLKPYVNTTLEDCSFVEHMNLDLSGLTQGHKIIMKNCTVNGQAVTSAVFTIPSSDAEYDTELFTVDLPSWANSIDDCISFN